MLKENTIPSFFGEDFDLSMQICESILKGSIFNSKGSILVACCWKRIDTLPLGIDPSSPGIDLYCLLLEGDRYFTTMDQSLLVDVERYRSFTTKDRSLYSRMSKNSSKVANSFFFKLQNLSWIDLKLTLDYP